MNRTRLFDLELERLVLGEGSAAGQRAFAERLATDPELRDRVASMKADDRDILRNHPPARFAADVRHRIESGQAASLDPRQVPLRVTPAWLLPVAVLATAFALWIPLHRHGGAPVPETDRAKGIAPQLHVYRQTGDTTSRLSDGDQARPSEVVQLTYVAGEDRFGTLVSVDGRGEVTLHFPEDAKASTALAPSGETPLPHAFELDDAPHFERFFLVTSPEPVDVRAVLEAARRLGADRAEPLPRLDLDPSLYQTSFLLRKESP
jgi:hypothetical protein